MSDTISSRNCQSRAAFSGKPCFRGVTPVMKLAVLVWLAVCLPAAASAQTLAPAQLKVAGIGATGAAQAKAGPGQARAPKPQLGHAVPLAVDNFIWFDTSGDHDWDNKANWKPVGVPNGSNDNAVITNPDDNAVNLNISPIVNILTIKPSATLNVNSGFCLTFAGTRTDNNGTININPSGEGTGCFIFDTNNNLTGGGKLNLYAGGSLFGSSTGNFILTNINNAILFDGEATASGLSLTNDAKGLIVATGTGNSIGLSTDNSFGNKVTVDAL